MKYPPVEELIARGIPEKAWDWIMDDDPILAEVHLHRYEMWAEYDFDGHRLGNALQLKGYACGDKVMSYPGDPRGLHEVEPPEDLTGLILDPEDFVREIRFGRKIKAAFVTDLDAFNEGGRRRAIRLGFPPDSWLIKKEEIDYRTWQEVVDSLEPED